MDVRAKIFGDLIFRRGFFFWKFEFSRHNVPGVCILWFHEKIGKVNLNTSCQLFEGLFRAVNFVAAQKRTNKKTNVGNNCRRRRLETSLWNPRRKIWSFDDQMASQKLLCSSPFRLAIPKRYNSTLNFDDFQNVYKFRSTPQLLRSYAILRLCGINLFVDNSLNVSWKITK